MACPHSSAPGATPEKCSLCQQLAPTERIVTTEQGVLMVNGIAIGTLVDRNKRRMREETATLSPAARAKLEREDAAEGE